MSDARRPLGLVLITPEKCCIVCGQKLTLRRDRPASITVYDDNLGPVPGLHFTKHAPTGHAILHSTLATTLLVQKRSSMLTGETSSIILFHLH